MKVAVRLESSARVRVSTFIPNPSPFLLGWFPKRAMDLTHFSKLIFTIGFRFNICAGRLLQQSSNL